MHGGIIFTASRGSNHRADACVRKPLLLSQRAGSVRLAYQPPASSAFLSEQISHQQPANGTFLS
jgi:hypothetical protein